MLSNRDSHCKHLQLVAFLETFEIHRSFALLPFLWQILCKKRKFDPLRKKSPDNKNLPKTKVTQTRSNGTYPLRTPRTRLRTKKDPQIMRVTKYNHGQELPTASLIWKENQNTQHHCFEHYQFFRFITWLASWVDKIDQILHCDWLPKWERWRYLTRSGLPVVSRKKGVLFQHNESFIAQVWGQNGWILVLLFFARLRTLSPPWSMSLQKKTNQLANIQPSWPRTWSINHLYINSLKIN